MLLKFNEYQFDSERFELSLNGQPIALEPKVLDLIAFMATNPDRILSKDEIVEAVWQGRFVSDATISTAVKAARRALGDTGKEQSVIRTVHGRGFRFVAPVLADAPRAPATPEAVEQPAPLSYIEPLLIIPPVRAGDDPGLNSLGEDFADRLRTALARVPFLTVMSRRAAEAMAHVAPTAMEKGYFLDIRISGDATCARATVELTDSRSGALIWSRACAADRDGDALGALTGDILPRLEPELIQANLVALQGDPACNGARPLMIQAMSVLALKGWHGASFSEAEALIRRSLDLDGDVPLSRAMLALLLALGQRVGFMPKDPTRAEEVLEHAEAAMSAAPRDSIVLGLAGCAIADLGHPARALPILRQALELNPDNAHAHAAIGAVHLEMKDARAAIDALELGIAKSPFDPRLSVWIAILALAYLKAGDMTSARRAAQQAAGVDDNTYLSRVVLAGVLMAGDDIGRAREALRECLRLKPDLGENDLVFILGPMLGQPLFALLSSVRQGVS